MSGRCHSEVGTSYGSAMRGGIRWLSLRTGAATESAFHCYAVTTYPVKGCHAGMGWENENSDP
ncbi:hypothetical protein Mame01_07290 [Microbispora amethystogenes]|nr:hypothetical protein Mame01_07290 [Microbispora amethystogenes]